MYQKNTKSILKHIDFNILDIAALLIAYTIAFAIRFHNFAMPFSSELSGNFVLILCISLVCSSAITHNHTGILKRGYLVELRKVLVLGFLTIALASFVLYASKFADDVSRLLTMYTGVFFVFCDYILRVLWKKTVIAHKWFSVRGEVKSLIILSKRQDAEALVKMVRELYLSNYEIKGLVFDIQTEDSAIEGIPVVGSIENASDFVCREWVDEILIAEGISGPSLDSFINDAMQMGVTIHSIIPIQSSINQFVEDFGDKTVLTTAFSYVTPWQAFLKRTLDIVGSLVGCVLTVIIGIFICPAIYISSPGPVIFRQKRIGKNGKPFYIYKFRSMYPDADQRKKDYLASNAVSDGMMFKMDFDPRIIGNRIDSEGRKKTGIGDFIRKTSLDEFPQFFNVLAGDMSLVGTRPPTEDEWVKYKYHHKSRMAAKPGITGMWQTSGRNDITDFEEVIRLDTEYIRNFSIWLDIKLLLKTVAVVLGKKGVK